MDRTRANESTASGEQSQAREQGKEVARQSKQQASWYAGEVRERAKDQIESRKGWASEELSGIARALHESAGQLQEQNQDSAGRYADQAAGQVGKLSGYLNDRDGEQLITTVEDFARSRPSVFLGGAFALGALAARFVKSSSEDGAGYERSASTDSGYGERDAGGGYSQGSSCGGYVEGATTAAGGSEPSSGGQTAPRRAGEEGRVR